MPDVNPIRFPSPYLLARDIFQLQSSARQVGIISAIVGHRTYTIHHINSSDWFTVERNGGGGNILSLKERIFISNSAFGVADESPAQSHNSKYVCAT